MCDCEGQKEREIRHMGDRVDYISNLPDCILHHILSFISTRDVVKTSVLSTRWKDLWTSVSNIDIDDISLYDTEMYGKDSPEVSCFMNFVERVLQVHDASNMEKFHLSCRACFDASRICSWISTAILHNVQELDLCLFVDEPSVLPRSMFNGKSLTSLKIEMICVLELPSCICFPCLKTLHLSLVTLPDDDSTQKLFYGCPVLQELVMLDCDWINLKNIVISSSTLKSLTIDDLPYFGPPYDFRGCKIKIDAANLTQLKYNGYLLNDIVLYDVSSLVKAYIGIPFPHERQKEVGYHAFNLLKGMCDVVFLRVNNRTIESLVCADNLLDNLPIFRSLTHLELTVEIGNDTVGALMKFLNHCPNLQTLHFIEEFDHDILLGEKGSIWLAVPKCKLSCLKTVTFKNFCGNDSEIYFLKSVLDYAPVVERINICCCKNRLKDPKKQKEVRKEIEMIARCSMGCVVTYS